MASTVSASAMPGGNTGHVVPGRPLYASCSIVPQLDVGGCTPKPRKLSPASASSAYPKLSAICTTSGVTALGNTCRVNMRRSLTPTAVDASMYVSSRTASTCARISRTKPGTNVIEIAIAAVNKPLLKIVATTRASVIVGNANSASVERDTTY